MGRSLAVRCPIRIDLAGGWSDVPAYCNDSCGEVVNIAINHYVTAKKTLDENRRLTVQYSTDMPIGSGLGTSGAMNVALMAAISGENKTSNELAEMAFQFESILGNTGGRQDQWASALGGINHLTFAGDDVVVNRLNPSEDFRNWLQNNLLLFDSKIQHISGELHDGVWNRFHSQDEGVLCGLDMIRDAGLLMASAISEEEVSQVVNSMKMVMAGVDLLDEKIHNPFREILAPLEELGHVLAWKAMGAGGGGVIGVIIDNDDKSKAAILDAMQTAEWPQILWQIEDSGITLQ